MNLVLKSQFFVVVKMKTRHDKINKDLEKIELSSKLI